MKNDLYVDITIPMQEKVAKLIESLFIEKYKIARITLSRIANIFRVTIDDLVDDSYILSNRDYLPNLRMDREIEQAIEIEKEREKEHNKVDLKLGEIDSREDKESKLYFQRRRAELQCEYPDPKSKRLVDIYISLEIQLWRIERAMRKMYLQLGDAAFMEDNYQRLANIFKNISSIYHNTGDRLGTLIYSDQLKSDVRKKMVSDEQRKKEQREEEDLLKRKEMIEDNE